MRTLREPIEVRDYAMFDKFLIRGILMYDPEQQILRISYSYGHLDKDKKSFVPSTFKEHHKTMTIEGEDFLRIHKRIGSKDLGTPFDILEKRAYEFIQEKYGWFRESQ